MFYNIRFSFNFWYALSVNSLRGGGVMGRENAVENLLLECLEDGIFGATFADGN